VPNRPTNLRFRALSWLALAAALAYLCRSSVGVAESTIRDDLGLTLAQSGWFMGAFFWTYAIFQVPSGWFSKQYGTRFALGIFALGWASAMLGTAVAPVLWVLIAAQLLMGAAQAGVFPAACESIGHWMPLASRSLACGILAAGMQVGGIAASYLTGLWMEPLGWRWEFVLFSLPSIAWAVGFLFFFRDHPEKVAAVNPAELALIHHGRDKIEPIPAAGTHELLELLAIASRPVLWFLCGQQVCRAAGYMFFASWFPTFLQKTHNVSIKESGFLQGLVLVGALIGSIGGGMVTDWIWRRTGNLRLSRCGVGGTALASCGLLILAAWFVQGLYPAVALLALGSMFAAIAGPCAIAATIDIGGQRVPQAFGMMNMCGNFATAACPVLVGWLFERTANWNIVLLLFAGVYLTGAICWVFVTMQGRPTVVSE